jgi:N-methylhydantoinase A
MTATDNSARIGVDVGGTSTDVILTTVRTLLSTPPNHDAAVVEAMSGLADGTHVAAVVHGTTVATNAVLERRGALTALVTAEGFRDVLELRRLRIPRMYEPFWRDPALVARDVRECKVSEVYGWR